jgi:hypothetical protein
MEDLGLASRQRNGDLCHARSQVVLDVRTELFPDRRRCNNVSKNDCDNLVVMGFGANFHSLARSSSMRVA